MSPVTADLLLSIQGHHTAALDLGVADFPFTLVQAISLAAGTASGQVDKVFTDTRTLAASATEDLDLAATLLDAYGNAITFVKVKAVIVRANAANINNINVTRPASNGAPIFIAAGDGIVLEPGFMFAYMGAGAGKTVTPATGDLFTITNAAGVSSVTYDVIIIGTSA